MFWTVCRLHPRTVCGYSPMVKVHAWVPQYYPKQAWCAGGPGSLPAVRKPLVAWQQSRSLGETGSRPLTNGARPPFPTVSLLLFCALDPCPPSCPTKPVARSDTTGPVQEVVPPFSCLPRSSTSIIPNPTSPALRLVFYPTCTHPTHSTHFYHLPSPHLCNRSHLSIYSEYLIFFLPTSDEPHIVTLYQFSHPRERPKTNLQNPT